MYFNNPLREKLFFLVRENSRSCLSEFSRENNFSVKKVHYEYNKFKKEGVCKLAPLINFEKLGFFRVLFFFKNSADALAFISKKCSFFINNSFRLDNGLFVECVFFTLGEREDFIFEIKKRGLSFELFDVEEILKQEDFSLRSQSCI